MIQKLVIGLTVWLVMTTTARADWSICNKTGYPVQVAIAYLEGDKWWSEGWWEINSGGECVKVYGKDLTNKYYYYAFHIDIKGGWSGDTNFCVSSNAFTIDNKGSNDDPNCGGRGYDAEGFRKIDTKDARSWTTNLTD